MEAKPKAATHWSTRGLAAELGLSQSTVGRIWRAFGLKPHRAETFKLSSDPFFVEKVRDVVGLYMSPPENAIVLCVDEKSQVQALGRTQPLLPVEPGPLGLSPRAESIPQAVAPYRFVERVVRRPGEAALLARMREESFDPATAYIEGEESTDRFSPGRVLDTRDGTGAPQGPVGQTPLVLKLTGQRGVPNSGVSAVLLNVTAVTPTGDTYVTVYPAGSEPPLAADAETPAGGERIGFRHDNGREKWFRRMVMPSGTRSRIAGSAPPNITFSPAASRSTHWARRLRSRQRLTTTRVSQVRNAASGCQRGAWVQTRSIASWATSSASAALPRTRRARPAMAGRWRRASRRIWRCSSWMSCGFPGAMIRCRRCCCVGRTGRTG